MKKKNRKDGNIFSKYLSLFIAKIFVILKKILILVSAFIFKVPDELKRYLIGIFFFLLFIFLIASNLNKGGVLGAKLLSLTTSLLGPYVSQIFLPAFILIVALSYFFSQYKRIFLPLLFAFFLIIFSISTILEGFKEGSGGIVGNIFLNPFFKLLGPPLTNFLLLCLIFFGLFILSLLFKREVLPERKPSILKRIFGPSFKVKSLNVEVKEKNIQTLGQAPKVITEKVETFKIDYERPPLNIFEKEDGKPLSGDIQQNIFIIKKTLENFGIQVEMGEVNVGPTVTQYTLKPAEGIKLSRITALSNDLALALAAHPIRIEAPIPGKSLVGIEIPNKIRSIVRLRSLLSDVSFNNNPSPLYFPVGKDVAGNNVFTDLAKMPHLLVCGATGTGKTLFLSSLILSLVYKNSPKILKFILIDPKRVEFPVYNDLPHNLTDVIVDVQKTVNALRWLVEEMERRFDMLFQLKARDIISFNKIALEKKMLPMPYIVIIIDELADLMAARGKEIEGVIVRLAQMARAVGIHLVLATQRPSTEVITGLIKANITARISFQVASHIDSRTVLDTSGAEKLLGRGDMLFLSNENPKPKRVQGAFVSENEIQKTVEYLKLKYKREKNDYLEEKLLEEGGELELSSEEEDLDDPLYEEAKRVVIEAKKASASLLQRRLKVGYARAARLLDILEKRGVVGPAKGSKPREVYLKEDEEWEKV
mgnify:CR=1 FL=1